MGWEYRFFEIISEEEFEKRSKNLKNEIYVEKRSDCYFLLKNKDHGVKIRSCNVNGKLEIKICSQRSNSDEIEFWNKIYRKTVGKPILLALSKSVKLLKKEKIYMEENAKVVPLCFTEKKRISGEGYNEITLLKCSVAEYNVEKNELSYNSKKVFYCVSKTIEGYSLSNVSGRLESMNEKLKEEKNVEKMGYPEFLCKISL